MDASNESVLERLAQCSDDVLQQRKNETEERLAKDTLWLDILNRVIALKALQAINDDSERPVIGGTNVQS